MVERKSAGRGNKGRMNELYGEWDIIAKVGVDKLEELDSLISDKIRSVKEIKETSTMIVAEYKK